jgi:hypothetical protein
LLLDCRKTSELPDQYSIMQTLNALVSHGHSAYLILPEAASLSTFRNPVAWVPNAQLFARAASGQTLKLQLADFFENYIKVMLGHEIYFELQAPAGRPTNLTPGIVNNVSQAICGRISSIYLLHPPAKKFEQKALKVLIEHFKPDPLSTPSVNKPNWVDQEVLGIPGVAEIQVSRTSILEQIDKKNEELKIADQKLEVISGWADLLWMEGIPLQNKVQDALNLLGVPATSEDPSGHTGDLVANEAGIHFVFEVTGSNGTIGIEKGRQLMQWVADAPDPVGSKGVLVASPFRNEPPPKRPPTEKRIFVRELEALAEKYHLALLDIRELYRLICLHLSGNSVSKPIVLEGLQTDGVVRFNI